MVKRPVDLSWNAPFFTNELYIHDEKKLPKHRFHARLEGNCSDGVKL